MPGSLFGAVPAVGEVVSVGITSIIAQSYNLNEAPDFGGLLTIPGRDGGAYFALCHGTETGAIEPGRHALAWGSADGDDIDVYDREPQLAHVLRTTFSCVLVGYRHVDGAVMQRVPHTPPRVHERVWPAPPADAVTFFAEFQYLRFLLRAGVDHVEDLMAASIGFAYAARGNDRAFLVEAGRAVARLLAVDYERLTSVLELLASLEVRK